MSTLLWIIAAVAWVCCGIAGAGHSFAYAQGEFRLIAKEEYKFDRYFSIFVVGLWGPIGLLATIAASGFEFKHGWRLRRERTRGLPAKETRMSERKLVALILGIISIVGACCSFYLLGQRRMKFWQDNWYTAHPVVRQAPAKDGTFFLANCAIEEPVANADSFVLAFPYQAVSCPLMDMFEDTGIRLKFHVSKENKWILPAPAPPAKPASELKWGDWFYGKHTDYKIATVDPCDIGMHAVGWGWGEVDCEKNGAKPAKGSKRHELTCKDVGGCTTVIPAQGSKNDCQYPEGCVTISQKTYFAVVDQLKRDAITMEKGVKEIKRLTAQPIPEKKPHVQFKFEDGKAWTWDEQDKVWIQMGSGGDPWTHCSSSIETRPVITYGPAVKP